MPTNTPAPLVLDEHPAATPTDLPAEDRETPAGLRWTADLESRPIILGHDHPEIRPVLDIRANRFWTGTRHGLAIGRARATLHDAAIAYAFAPDLRHAQPQQAALAHAGAELDARMTDYIEEAFV